MSGTQNDIHDVGEHFENLRHGLEDILDAFVWREQAESEQHHLSFHAEQVLEVGRIDKPHIGNPVRDEIDLRQWRVVDILQHPPAPFRHDDHPRRKRDQLLHHSPLARVWRLENGMKRCDHRHPQLAQ